MFGSRQKHCQFSCWVGEAPTVEFILGPDYAEKRYHRVSSHYPWRQGNNTSRNTQRQEVTLASSATLETSPWQSRWTQQSVWGEKSLHQEPKEQPRPKSHTQPTQSSGCCPQREKARSPFSRFPFPSLCPICDVPSCSLCLRELWQPIKALTKATSALLGGKKRRKDGKGILYPMSCWWNLSAHHGSSSSTHFYPAFWAAGPEHCCSHWGGRDKRKASRTSCSPPALPKEGHLPTTPLAMKFEDKDRSKPLATTILPLLTVLFPHSSAPPPAALWTTRRWGATTHPGSTSSKICTTVLSLEVFYSSKKVFSDFCLIQYLHYS